MVWVLLLSLEATPGEHGPGHAEGQEAGGGSGDEDVLIAQPEIDWTAGRWDDIADTQSDGGAVVFFVNCGTIRIVDGAAVAGDGLDVGVTKGIARDGFDIETRAGSVEGIAIAYEEGDENEMGLPRGK